MFSRTKTIAIAALAGCLGLGAWLFWLWQPDRQVRLHQDHLIKAAQERSWGRFARSIDSGYADRWGHDRAALIRDTGEVLRQFFTLTIREDRRRVDRVGDEARIESSIQIEGTGTALSDMAKEEVNLITTPFVFTWKKQSSKPWDWKLVRCDNAGLSLPAEY